MLTCKLAGWDVQNLSGNWPALGSFMQQQLTGLLKQKGIRFNYILATDVVGSSSA